MARLYAYGRCDVVVLKQNRPPQLFPESSGEALFRAGSVVELDGSDVWLLNADGQRTAVCVPKAANNGDGQRVTLGPEERQVKSTDGWALLTTQPSHNPS